MTKKKEMRIKDVGATINLGNYSTLHVTVGESSEYAGLEFQRAVSYLRSVADSVGGILNLPDEMVDGKKAKTARALSTPIGSEGVAFGSGEPVLYEHVSHTYTTKDGKPLTSVTQFLEKYYPHDDLQVPQEYMDFAANYGSLIHTAIQNSVIGKPPKKQITRKLVEDVLAAMGAYTHSWVEQFIVAPDLGLAGRFDILTKNEGKTTLWDVKTNSDLFMSLTNCQLPQEAKEYLLTYFNPETIYGEHCLQLNLYAYMLELSGEPVDEMKIIHVPDEFEKVYTIPKIDVTKLLELLNGQ